jgi:pimeloyl-ACP methyl ester carboxylesterase
MEFAATLSAFVGAYHLPTACGGLMTRFESRDFTGYAGVRLRGDVGGPPDGPPVVLLHGGGQTRHSWGAAAESLASDRYRVINLDARGHGDSDWSPDGRYGLDVLVADLRTIVAALEHPAALVGASMGGATALCLAGSDDAALVAALVLVDVVPRVEQSGADKIRAFMRANPGGFASVEEAADAVARYYPYRPRPRDASGLNKNLRRREDGRLHWHWDPHVLDGPHTVEPPGFSERMLAAAHRVRAPTMLVRGLRSDIVSDAGVAELHGIIPDLEVCNVAQAGHMVAGDRNDAFNTAVIDFLERHVPRRD